jgi:protein phosphatase 4 regulatory subunit 3
MATAPAQGWRVKLYQLNGDGQWDDRGTGSITVSHMDVFGGPGVHVKSEEGGTDILQSRILEDREAYALQGENIITWEERLPSESVDLALSFQENEGCLHIWNRIQEIQGNYAVGGSESSLFRDREDNMIGPSFEGPRYELKDLPECRIANLEEIRDQLLCPNMHRESVASMLLDSDCAYLKKLVAMFGDLEDLEDEDNLKVHVLREEDIVSISFSSCVLLPMVGCLDYLFILQ